ncbi:copper chaperone PCu(A)C [Maritalea sp. S77]|uniref:copper chaperone PCu(A)C n=1 Tax=Maritalea sp. S77 TaxID=3415125 RepID=UPI003C7E5E73
MNTAKFFAAPAVAALSIALFSGNALAHATLETGVAQPDSYYKAVVRVPHGCDGMATNKLVVELPEGFYNAKPMSHHGFALSVEKGAYEKMFTSHGKDYSEGVKRVIWDGGVVEDWAYDEFVIRGKIANVAAGDTLYFKATQYCGDAASVAWDQIPVAGEDRPAHPALALKIEGGADVADAHAGHDMSKDKMAEMVMAGDIKIEKAWTRATPNGAKAGGAFLLVTNMGDNADRLIAASSDVAAKVEIHEMSMKDGVMKMQQLEAGLEIAPGASVELKPGGFHIMMMGLNKTIAEGDMVHITLEFEKTGKVDVMFPAAPLGAPSMDHSKH